MLRCWKEPVLGSCRRRGTEWVETAETALKVLMVNLTAGPRSKETGSR